MVIYRMLSIINNISLLTPFTTSCVFAMQLNLDTSVEKDLLCLSIQDIMKLSATKKDEKLKLLKQLETLIKSKLITLGNKLQSLNQEINVTDIDIPDMIWHDVHKQLHKKQLTEPEYEKLKNNLFLLEKYLSLLLKWRYVRQLILLINNDLFTKDHLEDSRKNKEIELLLECQAGYIRWSDTFISNPKTAEDTYDSIFEIDMYDVIVDTYNANVQYIEGICSYKTQKCLLFSIDKIETLYNNKNKDNKFLLIKGLVLSHALRMKQEQHVTVSKKMKLLGLPDVDQYYHDVTKAEDQLITLQRELQEDQLQDTKELQIKISLLRYYFYLRQTGSYIMSFNNLLEYYVYSKSTNDILKYMLEMVFRQGLLIRDIYRLKNADEQNIKILQDNGVPLTTTQEELQITYDQIVDTHKQNVTYIETKCNNTTTQCLLFTIQAIENLNKTDKDTLRLIQGLVIILGINIIHERDKILQKLIKVLGLPLKVVQEYANNITLATKQLSALESELQDNKDNQEDLPKQISPLVSYIYLWYKFMYVITVNNVMYNCVHEEKVDAKKRYADMSLMATGQVLYLRERKTLKKTVEKHKAVFEDKRQKLEKVQQDVNDMYDKMIETHNENVTYIESILKPHTLTNFLALSIEDIEKLNTNQQDQLFLMKGLIDHHNIKYIQNKHDKILNILVSLQVITYRDFLNIQELHETLKNRNPNNKKETYILEHDIYLCSQYEYLDALSNYILSLTENDLPVNQIDVDVFSWYLSSFVNNKSTNTVTNNKKILTEKLQEYNTKKAQFLIILPQYLSFIQSNPTDKELQQCRPTKEEIEDILNTMSESNKKLLIKLLETNEQLSQEEAQQLQKELSASAAQSIKIDEQINQVDPQEKQDKIFKSNDINTDLDNQESQQNEKLNLENKSKNSHNSTLLIPNKQDPNQGLESLVVDFSEVSPNSKQIDKNKGKLIEIGNNKTRKELENKSLKPQENAEALPSNDKSYKDRQKTILTGIVVMVTIGLIYILYLTIKPKKRKEKNKYTKTSKLPQANSQQGEKKILIEKINKYGNILYVKASQ